MPFLEVTVKKFSLIVLAVVTTAAIASVAYASVLPLLFPTTPLQAVQVAAGNMHTCAVTPKGEAMCWGANWAGQLGDGTTEDRSRPTMVRGLNSGVTSISVGGSRGCAVQDGSVLCWGSNPHGQLGDGTSIDSLVPVRVSDLNEVALVAVGSNFSCALTSAEAVYCWGLNGFDRPGFVECCMLGDGTDQEFRATPTLVHGLTAGVVAISVADTHACALSRVGAVSCWGRNGSGQLGDGTTTPRDVPVRIAALEEPVAGLSAAGGRTCAVTTSGKGYCWGYNNQGQLGDGSTTSSSTPVLVSGLTSGAAAISTGSGNACAIANVSSSPGIGEGGELRCWGDNRDGQFGNGTHAGSYTPVPINTGRLAAVSLGTYHTCAIARRHLPRTPGDVISSVVQCWGKNDVGQLGDGTLADRNTPSYVLM